MRAIWRREFWPNVSNGWYVPLSKLQSELLRYLSAGRNPESIVAGAAPLSRIGPRTSDDLDIFHVRAEAIGATARADIERLEAAGFACRWTRQEPAIWTAIVERDGEATRLEWVHDSDYRFFPAIKDRDFGFVLHPVDIATSKALAAAGRREPRDIVDLLLVHAKILPLGAVIWAAVAKDPGFSPESIIAEIRRSSMYRDDDLAKLKMQPQISAAELSRALRAALNEAEEFVLRMPSEKAGLLFIENGRIVQPDPAHLDRYTTHAGTRGGHWPGSSEIASAMLEAWSVKTS
jgi:hypothetical protein